MVHTGYSSSGPCSGGSSDSSFSPHCALRFSALSAPPPRLFLTIPPVCHPERSEGSAFLATRHSSLATIHFRITFFAHAHHLTLTESTQTLPLFSTASKHPTYSNARNPNPFMRLLHRSRDTRGWEDLSFSSARLRALSVSALSFSVLRFPAPAEHERPQ
jgi:hypothetical protein